MKTQVELLKESCDIKDAACVKYQKRIAELEEENKKLKEENENLKAIIEHYKKFEEWKNKLEWMLIEEDTLQELRDLGKI